MRLIRPFAAFLLLVAVAFGAGPRKVVPRPEITMRPSADGHYLVLVAAVPEGAIQNWIVLSRQGATTAAVYAAVIDGNLYQWPVFVGLDATPIPPTPIPPTPTPVPPPDPTPTPTPIPVPVTKLFGTVIEETKLRTPADHVAFAAAEKWLRSNGGNWRPIDKDIKGPDKKTVPPELVEYLRRAQQTDKATVVNGEYVWPKGEILWKPLPYLILTDLTGTTIVFEGQCPRGDALLDLLKNPKGE